MAKLGFIGLGVMGYPMAGHLHKKGHAVTVYNRSRGRADKWIAEFGGACAPTPRDCAAGQEFVFACVGNDDDLRSIAMGTDGAFAGLAEGAIFVDHTTASAAVARELAAIASARNQGFIDAPVSGGQVGAENGALSIMCGGEPADYARAEPVIAAYAKAARLMGPAGCGQLTKMVNQICIAGIIQGLAEGLHFAQRAGLDPRSVVEVISKGAAQSWQMDNRAKTMVEGKFDFGFAVNWMRKDLAMCLEEARRNGAPLPAAALIDQFYADVQAMGGSRWDTSSLIARLCVDREARPSSPKRD